MCEISKNNNEKIKTKVCNVCGFTIEKVDGRNDNDYLTVKKQWNYFSQKDLTTHLFVVCETCYDQWIKSFTIPVEEKEVTEVFDFQDE